MPDGQGFEIGRDGPSAVVVGVDGSDTSMRAAFFALGVCRRQRSRLVVVYARTPTDPWTALIDRGGALTEASVRAQDDVEQQLRTAQEQARTQGIDVDVVVRTGDPYDVLVAAAHEVRADSVVVGSSTSPGSRLGGSLAVRLVRNAKWPVTVVP